jgi:hypothetical protein
MKLVSVTISNYRVHKSLTVTFDASRNVIGAPNEAGKSTLVEAVHHAFFLRSRVTGAVQKAMLSEFHPGHPTVELRFESGGSEYTITKVFTGTSAASTTLKQHATGLKDVNRGQDAGGGQTLRDEHAEERIHEILQAEDVGGGRNLESRLRMQWAYLWIWQGSATADPLEHANSDRHAALLRDRLARIDGAGVLESPLDAAVARHIADRHAATFTNKGEERTGSELYRAIKDLRAAEAAHDQAAAVLAALDEAVDTILLSEQTMAVCETKVVEARNELQGVRGRLREAAELEVRIAQEEAAATTAAALHAEAVRADAAIGECLSEIAALEARLDPDVTALESLELLELAGTTRSDAATMSLVEAGQRQAAAAAELAMYDVREKHERLLVERGGLGGRVTLIAEQRARARNLAAERDRIPRMSTSDLAVLVQLERDRELAEATLDAIATRVEVLATSSPVTLGGDTLGVGSPVTITADAELVIVGSGQTATVRISPGGGGSLAEATQRLEEARLALEKTLKISTFVSIDEARQAHARRQALEADIHAVLLAIEGLGGDEAEHDLAKLDGEIAAVAAELERRWPTNLGRPESLAAAEAALVAAERELAQAGQAVATATAEVADAKTNLEAVAAKRAAAADNLRANRAHLESLRTRAAVLQERHGADRTPRIAALDEAQKQATERLAGSRNHLAELNPEDLERNRDRLERTLELLASRKQDAETKRHLAKAKLDLQGTTDPREDMARATARRRLAAAEHARAVRDAEALKLLAGLFGEKKREVEEQFVAPLTSRIRGYLEQIFGKGTTVGVDYRDGTFSRLTLCRPRHEDTAFEFSQLSAGTKEQVAAAFRLAMAEVLSDDHDGCLPVVFDDAFVNADSHRHVRLQQLLDYAASRGLQVIVLACRPDMYLGLGAKMIELPGNPYAAANPADPR